MSLYAVKRQSGEALYMQIARRLEEDLGRIHKPGDCLPSEAVLAARFGVNRHTLRRAIDDLVRAGLLERRHGRGVFVLDTPLDYPIASGTRFTENLAALGLSASNQVLQADRIPAGERVAERLGLEPGAPVVALETLRTADERPFCLVSHFLPAERFPGLEARYQGGSLHRLVETEYGCVIRRVESLVTAVLPQGDDAWLLGMQQNRPVLRVKSLNVDERDGRPIEYAVTRFRAVCTQLRINP